MSTMQRWRGSSSNYNYIHIHCCFHKHKYKYNTGHKHNNNNNQTLPSNSSTVVFKYNHNHNYKCDHRPWRPRIRLVAISATTTAMTSRPFPGGRSGPILATIPPTIPSIRPTWPSRLFLPWKSRLRWSEEGEGRTWRTTIITPSTRLLVLLLLLRVVQNNDSSVRTDGHKLKRPKHPPPNGFGWKCRP